MGVHISYPMSKRWTLVLALGGFALLAFWGKIALMLKDFESVDSNVDGLPVVSLENSRFLASSFDDLLVCCYETYDKARADSIYSRILEILPDNIEYRFFEIDTLMGNLYLSRGEYDTAINYLTKSTENGAKVFAEIGGPFKEPYCAALLTYSVALRESGRIDEAKAVYRRYFEYSNDP